jgi:transcriptional regulator with XRE-family HTH domain
MGATTGLIIKRLREKYGYTQEKLAEFLGMNNREPISLYENGEKEVPIETLEKLSDLFSVELEIFFLEDPEEALTEVAFAFRKEELSVQDMEQIAKFGKIVKNYLKIKKLHNERLK